MPMGYLWRRRDGSLLENDQGMNEEQFRELDAKLNRILRLIDGDAHEDVKGIRPRLKEVEDGLKAIQEELKAWKNRAEGVKWVLGCIGFTTIINLVMVFRQWFG